METNEIFVDPEILRRNTNHILIKDIGTLSIRSFLIEKGVWNECRCMVPVEREISTMMVKNIDSLNDYINMYMPSTKLYLVSHPLDTEKESSIYIERSECMNTFLDAFITGEEIYIDIKNELCKWIEGSYMMQSKSWIDCFNRKANGISKHGGSSLEWIFYRNTTCYDEIYNTRFRSQCCGEGFRVVNIFDDSKKYCIGFKAYW